MKEVQIPLFFNSKRNNLSDDGGSFYLQFHDPIAIPQDANECTIEITNLTAWNVFHNIAGSLKNNKLHITTSETSSLGITGSFVLTIPDGQYDLNLLSDNIQEQLQDQGFPGNNSTFSATKNLIDIEALTAQNRVRIIYNYAATYCDFTQSESVGSILGYKQRLSPENNGDRLGGFRDLAGGIAKFNSINTLLLNTNLVNNGITQNGSVSGTLAVIPINARSGSQIVYTPNVPTRVDASELIGQMRSNIAITLTDESGNFVNTQGEPFTLLMLINYKI